MRRIRSLFVLSALAALGCSENGAFNHSTVLTVLSADGVARFRQDGLGDPPEATARAVKAALERDGRPRLGLLDR